MANTKSIAGAGNATSDAFAFPDGAITSELIVKSATDDESPNDDLDRAHVWLLGTVGDPDADPDSADEYTTPLHANQVASLNMDEDPIVSAPISMPVSWKSAKLYIENSGDQPCVVSAQMRSKTADGTVTETQVTWT